MVYVTVTLEREETTSFSEKILEKKASILKPENFVLYSQEQGKFPITSWI